MTQMVRKQIYIQERQNLLLKRLAEARGVSEAEVIRQALDRELLGNAPSQIPSGLSAWEEIERAIEDRKVLGKTGKPYVWNRQEIYEERESRWIRDREE
jgi:hypothetical protein